MPALFNHQRHLPLEEVPDQSRYYPYADNEMISTCLACDVMEGGWGGGGRQVTLIAGNVCSLITGLLTILIFFAAKDATISTWHPQDINPRQYI